LESFTENQTSVASKLRLLGGNIPQTDRQKVLFYIIKIFTFFIHVIQKRSFFVVVVVVVVVLMFSKSTKAILSMALKSTLADIEHAMSMKTMCNIARG